MTTSIRFPILLNKLTKNYKREVLLKALKYVVNCFSYLIIDNINDFNQFWFKSPGDIGKMYMLDNNQAELRINHTPVSFENYKNDHILMNELKITKDNDEILFMIIIDDQEFIIAISKTKLREKQDNLKYYKINK